MKLVYILAFQIFLQFDEFFLTKNFKILISKLGDFHEEWLKKSLKSLNFAKMAYSWIMLYFNFSSSSWLSWKIIVSCFCLIIIIDWSSRRRRHFYCILENQNILKLTWTNTLLVLTQVCPIFLNLATIMPSTALSRSAESKTMNGALPPNSKANFFTVPAHCR